MTRETVILTNDFHGATVTLRGLTLFAGKVHLSPRQIKRAKAQLCGSETCVCSGETGARGQQDWTFDFTRQDFYFGGLTLTPKKD